MKNITTYSKEIVLRSSLTILKNTLFNDKKWIAVLGVVAGISLIANIVYSCNTSFGMSSRYRLILTDVLVLAICLFLAVIRPYIEYLKKRKSLLEKLRYETALPNTITAVINDDDIQISVDEGVNTYNYHEMWKCFEGNHYWVLAYYSGNYIILDKTGFIEGGNKEFRKLIKKKLKIKKVKKL